MEQITLTDEQAAYVKKFSWGAFFMGPVVFFLANKMFKQGMLGLIPFYNIYVWIKSWFRGRRMAWASGEWTDFAAFQHRQKILGKIGVWIFVGSFTLSMVFGGIAGFTAFSTLRPVTDTASGFFAEMKDNPQLAYQQYTSAGFKSAVSYEEFADVAMNFPFDQITDIDITSIHTEYKNGVSNGSVDMTFDFRAREPVTLVLTMVKENDSWRVAAVDGLEQIFDDYDGTTED